MNSIGKKVIIAGDPLVVNYDAFDVSRVIINAPADAASKQDPSVVNSSCKIEYRYTKKDGTYQIAPLKIRGPLGWADEGVKENLGKEDKKPTGKYSYGHSISTATEAGRKCAQVFDQLYRLICQYAIDKYGFFEGSRGAAKSIANKSAPNLNSDFRVTAWDGCSYPFTVRRAPGVREITGDYSTKIWSGIYPSGSYPVKVYNFEKNLDAKGNPLIDPKTGVESYSVYEIPYDFFMNVAIQGYPTWRFNDWYIMAKSAKIRFVVESISMADFKEKGSTFEHDEIVHDELERRQKEDVDSLLKRINLTLKSQRGDQTGQADEAVDPNLNVGNPAAAFGSGSAFPNQNSEKKTSDENATSSTQSTTQSAPAQSQSTTPPSTPPSTPLNAFHQTQDIQQSNNPEVNSAIQSPQQVNNAQQNQFNAQQNQFNAQQNQFNSQQNQFNSQQGGQFNQQSFEQVTNGSPNPFAPINNINFSEVSRPADSGQSLNSLIAQSSNQPMNRQFGQ